MKNGWKKMLAVIFSSTLILAACSDGGEKEASSKKYKIGVTQIVEHPSLNAAFDGFKKALEDAGINAEYEVQNAQGDNSSNTTIATNLVSANVDLIFANSTQTGFSQLIEIMVRQLHSEKVWLERFCIGMGE